MLIQTTILTNREALPELDDNVLRIAEEESLDANPFFAPGTDVGKTIEKFADNERWQPAEDDNDPRFRVFAQAPDTPRPLWLPRFMDYARQRRLCYRKSVSAGRWSRAQRLCLRSLVLRFFNVSNAIQSTQALLRASVVFGCFLLCHQRSQGVMTNMVHHLSSSCPPHPPSRIAASSINQAVELAVPVNSDSLDRAIIKDLAVVIRNQKTLLEALTKINQTAIQLYSNDYDSEGTVLSDDE